MNRKNISFMGANLEGVWFQKNNGTDIPSTGLAPFKKDTEMNIDPDVIEALDLKLRSGTPDEKLVRAGFYQSQNALIEMQTKCMDADECTAIDVMFFIDRINILSKFMDMVAEAKRKEGK